MILQQLLHFFLHICFPGIVAYVFFRKKWNKAYLIFLLTMLVDLDHLVANPIFDPERCSINFHLLHKPLPILGYFIMLLFPKTRLIGLGLLMHMGTDYLDCLQMRGTIRLYPFELNF